MKRTLALVTCLLLSSSAEAEVLKVVTTLPIFASLAEEIGGDRITAKAISQPREDAHFVKPKPSFAMLLRDADLFITTGLDLELWAPSLVDKSGNRRIRDGQPGFVAASQNIPLLDVPASASREGGDVHVYGNPHLHTSPLNVKLIAANITAGLIRIDPAGRTHYEQGLLDLQKRLDVSIYGPELLSLLGSDVLDPLTRQGKLLQFLKEKEFEGRPLADRLGGWLGRSQGLRGQEIVAYHKNWVYLTDFLGLQVVDFVEPKPGIPPSPRHVHELIETIQQRKISIILSADYFDARKPKQIAERTGARAIIVPMETGSEAKDYFSLFEIWLNQLLAAMDEGKPS